MSGASNRTQAPSAATVARKLVLMDHCWGSWGKRMVCSIQSGRDPGGQGDGSQGDAAIEGADFNAGRGRLPERGGKKRIGLSVRGKTVGIGALDDEGDYCSLAGLSDFDQFVEMLTAAGGRCIRELGQAIGHQGDGFCLQPTNTLGPRQSKVEPALAVSCFRSYVKVIEIGQGAGGQYFGQQVIGQPGVDRDQRALVIDQSQIISRLAGWIAGR